MSIADLTEITVGVVEQDYETEQSAATFDGLFVTEGFGTGDPVYDCLETAIESPCAIAVVEDVIDAINNSKGWFARLLNEGDD